MSTSVTKFKFDLHEIKLQSVCYDGAMIQTSLVAYLNIISGQLLDSGVIYPFGNASKGAEQKIIGLVAKHRYTMIQFNAFVVKLLSSFILKHEDSLQYSTCQLLNLAFGF